MLELTNDLRYRENESPRANIAVFKKLLLASWKYVDLVPLDIKPHKVVHIYSNPHIQASCLSIVRY